MAYTFLHDTSGVTGTQAIYDLKTLLKNVGWTTTASGDGLSASSTSTGTSTDVITSGISGANGLANSNAWFALLSPGGVRQLLFQRSSTDLLWKIQYSPSAGFSGVSLLGTFAVTNGSATVTTTSPLNNIVTGGTLTFASQPGTTYTVSSSTSTTITLTAPYMGSSASATTCWVKAGTNTLSGTFTVSASTNVPTSLDQTMNSALGIGSGIIFSSQPGTSYTISSLTTSALTLSTAYTGTVNPAANGSYGASSTVPLGAADGVFVFGVSGTFWTLFSANGSYQWNAGASGTAPYGFWAGSFPTTLAAPVAGIVYDPLVSGSYVAPVTLSGTFNVQNGSHTVTTSSSQVGVLSAGAVISFASQTNVTYTVTSPVTATTITLSTVYSGTTNTATTASTNGDTDPIVIYIPEGTSSSVAPAAFVRAGLTSEVSTAPIIAAFGNINGSFLVQPACYLASGSTASVVIPSTLNVNPYNTYDDVLPIFYARRLALGNFLNTGIKGISSVMNWNAVSRNPGDTLTLVTTNDRIVYGDVNLPWDGSTPVT